MAASAFHAAENLRRFANAVAAKPIAMIGKVKGSGTDVAVVESEK